MQVATATSNAPTPRHYRVSTQFNWYAGPIAALLIGNFSEVILAFYRRRSEAAA